jgi:hypothetical protein
MVRVHQYDTKCLTNLLAGINAADITKLKSAGFYTVAVSKARRSHSLDEHGLIGIATGRSCTAQQAPPQDPRLLRSQGRESQGSCQEVSGMQAILPAI